MTENKLPEGVGKKIVEALKKQSEIEVTPIQETIVEPETENLVSEDIDDLFSGNGDSAEQMQNNDNVAYQVPPVQPEIQPQYNQPQYQQMQYQQPQGFQPDYNYQQPQQTYFDEQPFVMPQQQTYREPQVNYGYNENAYSEPVQNSYQSAKEFNIPSNVAVLKRLISQLPQGVTKQMGAQIIRQTMEALGISMSTVLTEAQNFQDGLNNAMRECVADIQEYRNNIKNLEKQVNDYQKQSAQVNDLISLFIMTDK